MQPLRKQAEDLRARVASACQALHIDARAEELAVLDEQLADSNVWANVERAQMLTRQAASLRSQIEPWQILRSQVSDIIELMDLGDDSMLVEFTEQLAALEAEYQERRKDLLFSGEYDNRAAILKLSAGAGGTDAQDWAEMLERMYLRWAEKHDMQTELVERSTGEEAGIKNATYIIRGAFAYGKLRSEHGVHRLVRLSPEMDAPGEVEIDDKDLRIDIYRSGGNGGQGVNTTDSAVRITHLPTGTVVAIQNERSQLQNKETALKILKSRLAQMQLEQRAETLADLRAGESASWGAQIRNYVLHPYTLVKDTRTKFETHNARGVLDGDIDGFIEAYLEQQAATE